MIFETLRHGGCMSYLVGCEKTSAALVVDPSLALLDRYTALAQARGLQIHYLLDTHTHADHFSAVRTLSEQLGVPRVMHRDSPTPFVDVRVQDGESLRVGELRFDILHTPGHTRDSICVAVEDRVMTGDTLLLGSTGRTDLPSGSPEELYNSLFHHLLQLDETRLVFPGHNYKGTEPHTLGEARATNPKLQHTEREAFVAQMRALEMATPRHLTEALRANSTGGKPVSQIIAEAARQIPFMSQAELCRRIDASQTDIAIVDVREEHAYTAGHIPGAVNLPRGQLELLVDQRFPDPSARILVYCEYGKISTLAAATLREMGFGGAVGLDGGMEAWRAAGHPTETDSAL